MTGGALHDGRDAVVIPFCRHVFVVCVRVNGVFLERKGGWMDGMGWVGIGIGGLV